MSDPTLFELAGGEAKLRAVVADFYDHVLSDIMIGFFFRHADKQRLIDKEYELAARMLGAPGVRYTGKPMREAHAAHRIMGGQFERRVQLLREAMQRADLPEAVQKAWLEHTYALRPQITAQAGSSCLHEEPR
jgi:hemoglobin